MEEGEETENLAVSNRPHRAGKDMNPSPGRWVKWRPGQNRARNPKKLDLFDPAAPSRRGPQSLARSVG